MPSIQFTPQIGTRETVSIPSTSGSRATLNFTAVLARDEYQRLVQDNTRLELWSNIFGDDWKEGVFKEAHTVGLGEGAQLIALGSQEEEATETTLHLQVSSPPQGTFGFTYRLVHSSGHVEWLGQFGSDGVLVLESTDVGLLLGDGWSGDEWPSNVASEGVEVAKLTKGVNDFSIWSLTDGKIQTSQPTTASILICVPKRDRRAIVCAPTLILTATLDASVSITPLGTIKFTGPPHSLLRLHHHDASSDLVEFAQGIFVPGWRVLHVDAPSKSVVIASPEGIRPVSLLVVPFFVTPRSSFQLQLKAATLVAGLPIAEKDQVMIYAAEIDDPQLLDQGTRVTLAVPRTAASFVVASLEPLGPDWKLAIATPHVASSAPPELLPTPPPSPRPRAVSRSFMISPGRESVSGDVTPLTIDVNAEANESSGLSSSSEVTEPPPSAMARSRPSGMVAMSRSVSFALTDTVIPISSRASIASTSPEVSLYDDGGIIAYVQYFVGAATVFLRTLFYRVFQAFYPEGEDDKAWRADETTPLLENNGQNWLDEIQPELESGKEEQEIVIFEEPLVIQEEEPEEEEQISGVSHARYFDVPFGKVTLLLRSREEKGSVDEIDVELDGKPIERAVRKLAASTCAFSVAVDVKESKGGKIKVLVKS